LIFRHMWPLTLGIGLFVTTVILVTGIKKFYSVTYDSNPFVYIVLFVSLIAGTQLLYPVVTLEHSFWLFCIGLAYVFVMLIFRYSGYIRSMYEAGTLPLVHRGIAKPTLVGDIVKVIEVLLQDIAAWLTVLGLLLLFDNRHLVIGIFTLLAFLLHVPGITMFGRVYGLYFLCLATLLAFTVPVFMMFGEIGFLYVFVLHLTTYLLMYLIMGYFGKKHFQQTK